MGKSKVKIFWSESTTDLEEEVNKFLAKEYRIIIHNTQMSCDNKGTGVMIFYEMMPKADKKKIVSTKQKSKCLALAENIGRGVEVTGRLKDLNKYYASSAYNKKGFISQVSEREDMYYIKYHDGVGRSSAWIKSKHLKIIQKKKK